MTSSADTTIPKVDYTTTPHPSGVKALSLKDAPALIESLLPVQKLSIDVFKERMAGSGQTLTALGSYWKGRKPLVLNRACVLAALLPATDDPMADLEVFELLMGMDDVSMSKRLGLAKPADIVRTAKIEDIRAYFVVDPPGCVLPKSAPFDLKDYPYVQKGKELIPRLKWRSDISETLKHEVAALTFEYDTYHDLATDAKRAEEVADEISTHIWSRVNEHLGTNAFSYSELVEQLGVMRFGHRPTVADTFSGSGQIPFAAAQLGCDVYASDLNPVACLLTWGSFNIVGASKIEREQLELEQSALTEKVSAELNELGLETDGNGWKIKAILYCTFVICPSTGWRVPVLPTLVVSKSDACIAVLKENHDKKRFDIILKHGCSSAEVNAADLAGTIYRESKFGEAYIRYRIAGKEYMDSMSSIRGDYFVKNGSKKEVANKVRQLAGNEFWHREDDILSEEPYAIQWIKDLESGRRRPTEFRSVSAADLVREQAARDYLAKVADDWEKNGYIPNTRIEAGGPPRYEGKNLIVNRGWTHWQHVYNPRQLIILGLLNKYSSAKLKPALLYTLNYSSKLCIWDKSGNKGQNAFYNQALNAPYNYCCRGSVGLLDFFLESYKSYPVPRDIKTSISNTPADMFKGYADIFVTDPPYGDAVRYEEINDYFIAWMRGRPISDFGGWIWDSRRELAVKGEDHDFRLSMVAAYKRMAECMPDNGIQVLMFTHQDGNIWADMANIVWASGLRVTAAWYLVTETDSALREGSYVKGTILLVLRKRLGAKRTNQTDLAYELEEEVAEQIKRLTGMNDTVAADSKRAKDGNLFEDADLQMAGYAAALKVLTKYSIIDGKDMAQEALRPRMSGQKTLVEGLIDFATDTANKMLVPLGLDESVWHDLEPAERFYLKMLEQESHGLNKLDNYQNFAKAFAVRDFSALMASENANKAALKSAKDFGRAEMNQSSELYQTPTRAVLYALMDLQAQKDLDVVLKGLEQNLKPGAFYSSRDMLVTIARFIGIKVDTMRPDEASAARVLADGIENQRM